MLLQLHLLDNTTLGIANHPTLPTMSAPPAPTEATTTTANPSTQSGGESSTSSATTPAPSTTTTATSQSSASVDEALICRWNNCLEKFNTAETLYVSQKNKRINY